MKIKIEGTLVEVVKTIRPMPGDMVYEVLSATDEEPIIVLHYVSAKHYVSVGQKCVPIIEFNNACNYGKVDYTNAPGTISEREFGFINYEQHKMICEYLNKPIISLKEYIKQIMEDSLVDNSY